MRSSMRALQPLESRDQSRRVGARSGGSLASSVPRVAHFGFPKRAWTELFDAGRIGYHPVFSGKPGFAARDIEDDADVRDVIELLRLNYERVIAQHGLPEASASR
jgi:hypothetical protein